MEKYNSLEELKKAWGNTERTVIGDWLDEMFKELDIVFSKIPEKVRELVYLCSETINNEDEYPTIEFINELIRVNKVNPVYENCNNPILEESFYLYKVGESYYYLTLDIPGIDTSLIIEVG